MPNVSIYVRDRIYRQILVEAESKGLTVAALIKRQVEDLYEQKTVSAKGEKVRPGIRK